MIQLAARAPLARAARQAAIAESLAASRCRELRCASDRDLAGARRSAAASALRAGRAAARSLVASERAKPGESLRLGPRQPPSQLSLAVFQQRKQVLPDDLRNQRIVVARAAGRRAAWAAGRPPRSSAPRSRPEAARRGWGRGPARRRGRGSSVSTLPCSPPHGRPRRGSPGRRVSSSLT